MQIVAMLVTLAKHVGIVDGRGMSFDLPISHSDIAEHLDVTRQAVQRECAALSAAQLIKRSENRWLVSGQLL